MTEYLLPQGLPRQRSFSSSSWRKASGLSPVRDAEFAILSSIKSDFKNIVSEFQEINGQIKSLRDKSVVYGVKLYDLGNEVYLLKCPLDIIVERFEDEFIARFPEIEVFGSGSTESESIHALKKEIIDLYIELSHTAVDEMGLLPKMWSRILNQLIAGSK